MRLSEDNSLIRIEVEAVTYPQCSFADFRKGVNPTDDMARLPPAHCTKIFVQRDYSDGTSVKFQTKFPQELEGKIERHIFEATVHELNAFYTEAETFSTRICCENCLACLTAYVVFLCMDTHYEKILKKIGRYIQEQNDSVYIPRGLLLIDPVERGLRVLEVCILVDNNCR